MNPHALLSPLLTDLPMFLLTAPGTVGTPGSPALPGNTPGPALTRPPTFVEQLISFFPFLLILVVFYLVLFLPKRKQEKERLRMISELKRNDRVLTYGGIKGTVIDVRPEENEVVLKVDEGSNTKIRFDLSAINRVVNDAKAEAKK